MIGVHEARRARHDAVTIGVGVVGEGDVEFVAQADQPRHGVGGRTVHPNLTVPIQSHKTERRVYRLIDDRRREVIAFDDPGPILDACAAERIDPNLDAGRANGFHVQDIFEVGDIRANVVVALDIGRITRARQRDAPHAIQIFFENGVGRSLNPHRHPAPAGRHSGIIFEAAFFGGLCEG